MRRAECSVGLDAAAAVWKAAAAPAVKADGPPVPLEEEHLAEKPFEFTKAGFVYCIGPSIRERW